MQDGHKTHDGSGNIYGLLHHIRPDRRLQAALQRVEERQRGHDGDRHQVALKIADARQQAAQRHTPTMATANTRTPSAAARVIRKTPAVNERSRCRSAIDQLISRDQLTAKYCG